MPTRAEIVAAVEEYVGAVGRHDLEATLACFAEDARQEDPVGMPANVGIEVDGPELRLTGQVRSEP